MEGKVIEYKSPKYTLRSTTDVLEIKTNHGIECTWSGKVIPDDNNNIKCTWKFNLKDFRNKEFSRLKGYILIKRSVNPSQAPFRSDIDLVSADFVLEKTIENYDQFYGPDVEFEYYLTPYYKKLEIEDIPYEVMFLQSEKTDAILVVDGKKLYVNKSFLSFHSDFFRALFSSNYKEGQMDEIPNQDVSYDEFGCLLSLVYPQSSFPTDSSAGKLLELADRFMMPSVIRQVEYFLLNLSHIGSEKLMWMADKYSMQALLMKSIQEMGSVEKAKNVKNSTEYKDFSDKTKAALFERLVEFI